MIINRSTGDYNYQTRIRVPWPLRSDYYTVTGGNLVSSRVKEKSCYYFSNRISPKDAFPDVAQDSRMVLYGLSDFVRNHLFDRVTYDDIEETKEFLKNRDSIVGDGYFDEQMWRRVVKEHNGYLPISITSLPEGSVFFPNEPIIQVEAINGFGEIAAFIEPLLVGMVSTATAKVTFLRHWFDRLREIVKNQNKNFSQEQVDSVCEWMVHDFGMRASSCLEESEILGRAQLLVFNGTDTTPAAYQAWKLGAKQPIGTSISALAHRTVQSYDEENDCYENSINQCSNSGFAAMVADCYDFEKTMENFIIPLAKLNPNKTIVARPDSGDDIANTYFIIGKAIEAGLYKRDDLNRYVSTNLRMIHGNSMNPKKVEKILSCSKDWLMSSWVSFGVGGYSRNIATRDALSSSYKLSAVSGDNKNEWKPVAKISKDKGKMSVPGPSKISRNCDRESNVSVYHQNENIFYQCDQSNDYFVYLFDLDNFNDIRGRVRNEFDDYKNYPADYGLNHSCLSEKTKQIRDEIHKKYLGETKNE